MFHPGLSKTSKVLLVVLCPHIKYCLLCYVLTSILYPVCLSEWSQQCLRGHGTRECHHWRPERDKQCGHAQLHHAAGVLRGLRPRRDRLRHEQQAARAPTGPAAEAGAVPARPEGHRGHAHHPIHAGRTGFCLVHLPLSCLLPSDVIPQ